MGRGQSPLFGQAALSLRPAGHVVLQTEGSSEVLPVTHKLTDGHCPRGAAPGTVEQRATLGILQAPIPSSQTRRASPITGCRL